MITECDTDQVIKNQDNLIALIWSRLYLESGLLFFLILRKMNWKDRKDLYFFEGISLVQNFEDKFCNFLEKILENFNKEIPKGSLF